MAARRAQELYATVIVVERSWCRPGWGNSLISGGALHAAMPDPHAPPAELVAEIGLRTEGHSRPDVAGAFATALGEDYNR